MISMLILFVWARISTLSGVRLHAIFGASPDRFISEIKYLALSNWQAEAK
jgi:hypothetical protein